MSFSLDSPDVTTIVPGGFYIITEGHEVTATCAGSGGNPDVYMYRFKQITNNWTGWSSTYTKGYSGLSRDKEGEYKCQTQNDVGNGPIQTFQLVVHCKFIAFACHDINGQEFNVNVAY